MRNRKLQARQRRCSLDCRVLSELRVQRQVLGHNVLMGGRGRARSGVLGCLLAAAPGVVAPPAPAVTSPEVAHTGCTPGVHRAGGWSP